MNGSSVDKPKKRHHPGTAPANRDQQIKRTAGLLTMAHAELDQIFETAADGPRCGGTFFCP
jgi:hypothetical protein